MLLDWPIYTRNRWKILKEVIDAGDNFECLCNVFSQDSAQSLNSIGMLDLLVQLWHIRKGLVDLGSEELETV